MPRCCSCGTPVQPQEARSEMIRFRILGRQGMIPTNSRCESCVRFLSFIIVSAAGAVMFVSNPSKAVAGPCYGKEQSCDCPGNECNLECLECDGNCGTGYCGPLCAEDTILDICKEACPGVGYCESDDGKAECGGGCCPESDTGFDADSYTYLTDPCCGDS